jgi:Rieske Fe-S protein
VETNNNFPVSEIGTAKSSCGSCAVTRREAILLAATASVLALLPIFKANADTPDQWVAVGKASSFTVGAPVMVTPATGEALYVTRIDSITVVAVSAKCTHHGCKVAWMPADSQFECPCHGAAFTSTGKNVHGTMRNPAMGLSPLLSLPTKTTVDGNVEVNLAGIDVALLTPKVS